MAVQIPDKLYFKIGEVAGLTGVKPHVLRYWESEFAHFRPGKGRNKQRLYRRQDIELVLCLKDLLYRQGFTIAGARKRLQEMQRNSDLKLQNLHTQSDARRLIDEIHEDLMRLRASLNSIPEKIE
ncbi:MAG TPA: MerR family transcriptional regulator [Desulfuromonadales bacterium]|nr:MerR family transcriptional regulator [Desulfuromonadales bacterium]